MARCLAPNLREEEVDHLVEDEVASPQVDREDERRDDDDDRRADDFVDGPAR